MKRTPGMLNPLGFGSEKEFAAALQKQGEDQGWTPMEQPPKDGSTQVAHVLAEEGGKAITSEPNRKFIGHMKLRHILKRNK